MTSEEIRMLTKKELVAEYERTIKWYTKSTILIVILANTLKCFGYCLMMEQIPICGQLMQFAFGFMIATKKNWKRNWICIFNSN